MTTATSTPIASRSTAPPIAITTEDIDLGADEVDWAPDGILGNVRVQVEGDKPVFVGIGPDADVDRYLRGVAHDELVDFDGDDPELRPAPGQERRARHPASRTSGSPSPRAPESNR